jgi:hypothetical protein
VWYWQLPTIPNCTVLATRYLPYPPVQYRQLPTIPTCTEPATNYHAYCTALAGFQLPTIPSCTVLATTYHTYLYGTSNYLPCLHVRYRQVPTIPKYLHGTGQRWPVRSLVVMLQKYQKVKRAVIFKGAY